MVKVRKIITYLFILFALLVGGQASLLSHINSKNNDALERNTMFPDDRMFNFSIINWSFVTNNKILINYDAKKIEDGKFVNMDENDYDKITDARLNFFKETEAPFDNTDKTILTQPIPIKSITHPGTGENESVYGNFGEINLPSSDFLFGEKYWVQFAWKETTKQSGFTNFFTSKNRSFKMPSTSAPLLLWRSGYQGVTQYSPILKIDFSNFNGNVDEINKLGIKYFFKFIYYNLDGEAYDGKNLINELFPTSDNSDENVALKINRNENFFEYSFFETKLKPNSSHELKIKAQYNFDHMQNGSIIEKSFKFKTSPKIKPPTLSFDKANPPSVPITLGDLGSIYKSEDIYFTLKNTWSPLFSKPDNWPKKVPFEFDPQNNYSKLKIDYTNSDNKNSQVWTSDKPFSEYGRSKKFTIKNKLIAETTYDFNATLEVDSSFSDSSPFDGGNLCVETNNFTTQPREDEPLISDVMFTHQTTQKVDDWTSEKISFSLGKGWAGPNIIDGDLTKIIKNVEIKYTNEILGNGNADPNYDAGTKLIINGDDLNKGENNAIISKLVPGRVYYVEIVVNYNQTGDAFFSKNSSIYNDNYHFRTKDAITKPTLSIGKCVNSIKNKWTQEDVYININSTDLLYDDNDKVPLLYVDNFINSIELKNIKSDDNSPEDKTISSQPKNEHFSKINNVLRITGLKPETTYSYDAVLTFTSGAQKIIGDNSPFVIGGKFATKSKLEAPVLFAEKLVEKQTDNSSTKHEAKFNIGIKNYNKMQDSDEYQNSIKSIKYKIEKSKKNEDEINDNVIINPNGEIDNPTLGKNYEENVSNLEADTYYTFTLSAIVGENMKKPISITKTYKTSKNKEITETDFTTSIEYGAPNEENNNFPNATAIFKLKPEFINKNKNIKKINLKNSENKLIDCHEMKDMNDRGELVFNLPPLPASEKISNREYYFQIIENDDTDFFISKSHKYWIASGVMPLLAAPEMNVTVDDNDVLETSLSGKVNYKNFNNIATKNIYMISAKFPRKRINLNPFFPNGETSDSFSKSFNLEDLIPNTDYTIHWEFNSYSWANEPSIPKGKIHIKTHPRSNVTYTDDIKFTQKTNEIDFTYSWDNNLATSKRVANVDITLINPFGEKDGEECIRNSNNQFLFPLPSSGNKFVKFTNLINNTKYKLEETITYEDSTTLKKQDQEISTKEKRKNYSSHHNINADENNIYLNYSWINKKNVLGSANVIAVKLEAYQGDINSEPLFHLDFDNSELTEKGSIHKTLDVKGQQIGAEYTVVETITYDSRTYISEEAKNQQKPVNEKIITKWEPIKTKYNSPEISLKNPRIISDNEIKFSFEIKNPEYFEDDNDNKISITLSDENSKYIYFVFNKKYENKISLSPKKSEDITLSGIQINKYDSFRLRISSDNNVNNKTISAEELIKNNHKHKNEISPNQMNVVNRTYDETLKNGSYIYEINLPYSLHPGVSLQKDITFTKKEHVSVSEIDPEINILNNTEIIHRFENRNMKHLYISIKKESAPKNYKDLSFLVGRFMIFTFPWRANGTTQHYYYISSFKTVSEPLGALAISFITAFSLLLIILILILIIKFFNNKRWYEYSKKYAVKEFEEIENNMNMFGWNPKYEEYLSLLGMSTKQLDQYAKEIQISLPVGTKKQEKINILSLLNETELERVKLFLEYEVNVSNDQLNYEINNFKNGKYPIWIKMKLKYTIDKEKRNFHNDYKKSIEDRTVDKTSKTSKIFKNDKNTNNNELKFDESEDGGLND